MTKTIPISALNTLPVPAAALALNVRRIQTNSRCSAHCNLAFLLPWMAITLLGVFSTAGQPASALVCQALIPGLMAGGSGLMLYKLTKKVLKHLRSNSLVAL